MKKLYGFIFTTFFLIGCLVFTSACGNKEEQPEKKKVEKVMKKEVDMELQAKVEAFLTPYLKEFEKKIYDDNITYWKASNSGKKEDFDAYAKANLELKKLHSDSQRYAKLEEFRAVKNKLKPITARSLEIAYLEFKGNQLSNDTLEQLSNMAAEIEQTFNTFRGNLDGKKYSNNELMDILKPETNSAKRQKIWEALKQVGEAVAPKLIELAKIRNTAAQKLGYKNYWEMEILLQEHNPDELMKLFNELEELTNEPFRNMKAQMDKELAARFKIKPEEMMPWHYDNPFFQEPPPSDKVNLDEFYKGITKEKIVEIAKQFYSDAGLPIDDIVEKSDLYEREGKQPHAYCISIDQKGDVRASVNIKPNAYWMDTMLHEMGHAVYDKHTDLNLPINLREPAHEFTTEGIAMLFGALAKNPYWKKIYLNADEQKIKEVEKAILEQRRREQLLFCRWTLVMLNFEKAFYENPEQELNTLWWDMVERFQLLKRPENRNKADWAAKIHFTIAPVYYHNYQMGELFAAQLRGKMVKLINHNGPSYTLDYKTNQNLGKFLLDKVFKPCKKYPWPEFVKKATGEPLTAKYFAEEVK